MTVALRITTESERAIGLRELASALVGLHAARHSGPYVAAFGRLGSAADPAHSVIPADGGLVQLRCMRGTLHAMPVDLASVAHAATRDLRVRASCARLARCGHSKSELASA